MQLVAVFAFEPPYIISLLCSQTNYNLGEMDDPGQGVMCEVEATKKQNVHFI